eukprot:COSAG04_NODE_964_length_9140_cov_15.786196_10_plen_150_part_00
MGWGEVRHRDAELVRADELAELALGLTAQVVQLEQPVLRHRPAEAVEQVLVRLGHDVWRAALVALDPDVALRGDAAAGGREDHEEGGTTPGGGAGEPGLHRPAATQRRVIPPRQPTPSHPPLLEQRSLDGPALARGDVGEGLAAAQAPE